PDDRDDGLACHGSDPLWSGAEQRLRVQRSGWSWVQRIRWCSRSSLLSGAGTKQLRPHDRLVEAELTVQLLGRCGLRGEVDDGVDALGLLLDLVGQATTAPDVDVVDGAPVLGDDGEELL